VLFVNPAATQAQRLAGSPYVQSRRQVAPIEADSKVGDRPDDHPGDTAPAEHPVTTRRTSRHIDMYV
jgi:hypothetical protein